MFLITIGLAAAMVGQTDGVRIPIHHVSARYVVLQLAQKKNVDFSAGVESTLAPGMRIFLDPSRNGLLVKGPVARLHDLEQAVALFDVRPQSVRLAITGSVPGIGFDQYSIVTVSNNTSFSFKDVTADLAASVTPRYNEDGTVTVFFEIERQGRQIATVARTVPGRLIRVVVSQDGTVDVRMEDDVRNDLAGRSVPDGAAVILVLPTLLGHRR